MKQILEVVRFNFEGFLKNPRIIITFLFAFILCFFLSDRAIIIADYFDTPMQAAEPFIWTFGDSTSILLCSLLLILMFMNLPNLSPVTPYLLVRIKKSQWLAGQFIYIIAVTGMYLGYTLIVTCVLCMRRSFIGNIWSKTAALLAYSQIGKGYSIPSTVKVMESTSPYECMFQIIVLMLLYTLVLSFVMLLFQIVRGKRAGILAGFIYSMFGFLLNPDVLMKILHKEENQMYKIRSIVGWISPLNQATYKMHDFGYDKLPSIFQSVLLFFITLFVLYFIAYKRINKYNFSTFTGV